MPNTAPIAYALRAVSPTGAKHEVEIAPGDAISIQGDRFGNVLFPVEAVPVPADKFNEGLDRCLEVAKSIVTKTSNFASSFHVETVSLNWRSTQGSGSSSSAKLKSRRASKSKSRESLSQEAKSLPPPTKTDSKSAGGDHLMSGLHQQERDGQERYKQKLCKRKPP
jgi:hypothetical protein